MRSVQFIIAVGFVILASTAWTPEGGDLHESVSSLLEALGDDPSPHYADLSMEHASMDRGKDIVLKGKSNRQGKKSRLQSKYFTCVACHNVEREDPDLADPSPKARLPFVAEKQLPYLQGSPLYGVVNRSSFYNGDYEKKYGDLVKPTRRDLRKA
ncbi:MAG: hypothetical protein OEQ53_12555, partial [Saprospiraceae bacterium]|nr:hypothetical protein [Saprospiraceae bacterium]